MKEKRLITFLINIFLLSYMLNFIWESLHAYFLYEGTRYLSTAIYIRMVLYTATMDALFILLLFLTTALLLKDQEWPLKKKGYYVFFILGLLLAAGIEYNAIFLTHKWSYSALMPTVFGIGLSPLIQLSSTGISAIFPIQRFQTSIH